MNLVITGMGAVTPLGIGREETWQSLVKGKSGVGYITRFDAQKEGFPVKIGAEVKSWDPKKHLHWLDQTGRRAMHRSAEFAEFASKEAKEQAGLLKPPDVGFRYDTVNLIGTGAAGSDRYEQMTRAVDKKPGAKINPFHSLQVIANTFQARLAKTIGADQQYTFNTACATSGDSMRLASKFLRDEEEVVPVTVAYTGGGDAAISETQVLSFYWLGALSTRNDAPKEASRPFDNDRDGFVMGEGAVVLIIEREDFAKKRGAKPLARFIGWSSISREGHETDPQLPDMVEAIERALQQARREPEDIDLIVAHGTSTPKNDQLETEAIKKGYGERAYKIPITGPKSMVGHLLGSAGGVNALVAVKAMQTGIITPTINYGIPDPHCDLDYVPNVARSNQKVRTTAVHAFGFGNQNSVLIFEEFAGWKV